MQRIINVALAVGCVLSLALAAWGLRGGHATETRLRANVVSDFNRTVDEPKVGAGSYVDPLASLIGDVRLGRRVLIAPFASARADAGRQIRIGSKSNIQDGAVLQAAAPSEHGAAATVEHNGRAYAVYIGDEVSISAQAQVHGPAKVGDRAYVGPRAVIFRAEVGENSVVEPGAVISGVRVPAGRYVPAGTTVATQQQADALPPITSAYPHRTINDDTVKLSLQLVDGYLGHGRSDAASSHAAGAPTGHAEPPAIPKPDAHSEPKTSGGATGAKPAATFPAAPSPAGGGAKPAAGH